MAQFKLWLRRLNVWGFLGLIIVTPFLLHYLVREPVAISSLNIYSLLLIALTALNVLLGQLKSEPLRSRSLAGVIILLILMLVWGTIFSEPLRTTLGPWTNRFLQPLLVGYVGYLLLRQQLLSRQALLAAFGLSLGLIAVQGLLQATGFLTPHTVARATGPYEFPNSFARWLEILLLLLAPFVVLSKDESPLWLKFSWLLGLLALVTTKSYAGVGSFLIGLAAIAIALPRPYRRTTAVFLSVLMLVSVAGFLFKDRLPKYEATVGPSLKTRQQFWHIAWETIKIHSLTGIGLEGWEHNYLNLARTYIHEPEEKIIETVSAQPHNIFFDGWLRGGLFGLVAVVSFLVWPIVFGWRTVRRDQLAKGNWLALGALGLGVALLAFGLVDDPIFSDDAMLLLFVGYFALAALSSEAPTIAKTASTDAEAVTVQGS